MRFWHTCTITFLLWMVCIGFAYGQNNPNDTSCSPANLLLVVDTSGSMSAAGKLEGLKKAATDVVNQFKTKLRMGIIRFSSGKAELLVPMGPPHAKKPNVEAHAQKLLSAIAQLKALGDTPMWGAMELAHSTMLQEIALDPVHKKADPLEKRRNFVLLVTDGEPTDAGPNGETPLNVIQALRKLKVGPKTYDVLTFVVGLGDKKNIRTFNLQQYAIAGGTDHFRHALKPQDLASIFKDVSNTASKEVCDGKDNDCDGQIDEDLERECSSACGKGKEICHKGKWDRCDAPAPKNEICNGLDDNCNGKVDEGTLTKPCSTACGKGVQSCIQGDWSTCSAPRPEAEICDGLDNDCNGQIDDGSLCPGGKCIIDPTSKKAVCDIPCTGNECPAGYVCVASKCKERPCARKKCAPGETCDDTSGKAICKNPCSGVQCPADKTCGASGRCIDCYKEKCAQGQVCLNGKCVNDKCETTTCSTGQVCLDGVCFKTCAGVKCPAGERCVKGACQPDACKGKACPSGQTCVDGACVVNKCIESTAQACIPGTICSPQTGLCEDDPCLRIKCGEGVQCFRGQCGVNPPKSNGTSGSFCSKDADCSSGLVCKNQYCVQVKTQGGVGCGCSSEHSQHAPWTPFIWILGCFGFLLILRIRRFV